MSFPRQLLLLIILLVQGSVARAFDIGYYADGEVNYEVQNRNGQKSSWTRKYELRFDKCRWKIVVQNSKQGLEYVYQYDREKGELLYYVVPVNRKFNASGRVENCEVPSIWISGAAEYVWLALASGCYFEHATKGVAWSLEALTSRSRQYKRFETPADIRLSAMPPHLPTEVQYFTDKFRSLADDGSVIETPLPEAFQEKFTSAKFKSTSFTNVGGLSFPTAFEFDLYQLLPTATATQDLRCILKVRGKVSNISLGAQTLDFHLPTTNVPIEDLRIPQRPAFLKVDDGIVPSVDDSKVEDSRRWLASQRSTSANRRPPQKNQIKLKFGLTLFFVVSTCAFVFFCLRNTSKPNKS